MNNLSGSKIEDYIKQLNETVAKTFELERENQQIDEIIQYLRKHNIPENEGTYPRELIAQITIKAFEEFEELTAQIQEYQQLEQELKNELEEADIKIISLESVLEEANDKLIEIGKILNPQD